ncbi:MAG: DUF3943 domain-containing protein [Tannerella sp.]|nr:DUF3943 domain-containing protein [Tannerella sp.]
MNEEFAKIGINSFKQNLSSLPVWDTDKFSTNLIAHPYHGGLYFNAARSNGMSFWKSVPFTLGGSLMWEYFMENELPSVNDLFATTFGGMELGEITFRLSDLFIDNRSSGGERIGREILVTCISPVRGINRLITGESWKRSLSKGRMLPSVPVYFSLYTGLRFLAEQERSKDGELSMVLGFNLAYNDQYSESQNDHYRPYEWFVLNGSVDLFSSQPLMTQLNAIGILWGKNVKNTKNSSLTAGIFQHFDFYDSQIKNKEKQKVAPYRISEAVAFGGGILYLRKLTDTHPMEIRSSFYANAIILGGSLTDHYFYDEKDYNLGSGYSVKTYTNLTYKKKISFDIQSENYHIFTWKGNNPDGTGKIHKSSQGDIGNSRLIIFSTRLSYIFNKKWNISISNRFFTRYTHYKYYEDTIYSTNDGMLTAGYTL